MKRLTILGSTGSIGRSTLALVEAAAPGDFTVEALVAGRDVAALAAQARNSGARLAVVADPSAYAALREALAGSGIEAAAGPQAVIEAAARPADWTMAAIVGSAGLHSTLAVLDAAARWRWPTRRALVCAGEIVACRGGTHRRHAAAGGQRAQRHLPGARHQDPARSRRSC